MSTNRRTLCAGVLLLLLSCNLAGTAGARETCGVPPSDLKLAKALALYAKGLFYLGDAASMESVKKGAGFLGEAVALDPESAFLRRTLVKALVQSGDETGALAQQLELARRTGSHTQDWKDAAFLALSVGSDKAFGESIAVLRSSTDEELSGSEMDTAFVRSLEIVGWAKLHVFEKALGCFAVLADEAKADVAADKNEKAADLWSMVYEVSEAISESPDRHEVVWKFAEAMRPLLKDKQSEGRLLMLLASPFSQASKPDPALVSALCTKALEAEPLNYRTVMGIVFPIEKPGAKLDLSAMADQIARHPRPDALESPFAMMRLELLLNDGDVESVNAEFKKVEALRAARFAGVEMPEEYYALASSALDLLGKREAALALLDEGLLKYPSSDMIMNSIAYTMALEGKNLVRALNLIDAALKHDPENYAYLDTLGWVLYKTGDYDGALRSLTQALGLCHYACQELYDHIGDVLVKLGREAESPAWWAKSYSIKRDSAVAEKLQGVGIDPALIP